MKVNLFATVKKEEAECPIRLFRQMNMSRALTVLVAATSLLTYSQDVGNSQAPQTSEVPARSSPIRVAGKIVQIQYCRGADRETATLRLSMDLIAQNVGSGRVVFPVASVSPSRIVIASDEQALKSGAVISDSEPHYIFAAEQGEPQSNHFVVLGEGKYFKFPAPIEVSIPFAREGFRVPGFPGTGRSVVQVTLSVWPYGRRVANEWRVRWQSKGYLSTDPVEMSAIEFTIEPGARIDDCEDR